MTVFTILGLVFNIKTNVIHHDTKVIMKMLSQIREENRLLEYKIFQETRLDRVESIARDRLHMIEPSRIIYFDPKEDTPPHAQ